MANRLLPSIYYLLPHDLEAEKSIFRAVVRDNHAMVHVTENLLPEDFYRPAHQIICSAIYELFMYNEPVNLETLIHILKEKGKLSKIDGEAYLSRIVKNGEAEPDVEYYAKIVRDKACLRRLIKMSNKIIKRCYDEANVDNIIDFVERSVFEILEKKIKPQYYHIDQLIEKNIDILEECQMDTSKVKSVLAGVNPSKFKGEESKDKCHRCGKNDQLVNYVSQKNIDALAKEIFRVYEGKPLKDEFSKVCPKCLAEIIDLPEEG